MTQMRNHRSNPDSLTSVRIPSSPDESLDPGQFRVLLYSRVSSPRQAKHGHSIHIQPENLKGHAEAHGWAVVGEVSDAGRTGRNDEREGFKKLMQALKHHRPDAVLTTRLARFMRNARLTLNAVHEMREMGVALICTDEPIDTRQRGLADLFLAILATMAEWESDRLSEYAKETRERLIAKGRLPSGRPPYGYSYDKAAGELIIDEDKAKNVRIIYSLYTDRRMGMHTIAVELAARAVKSPRGNNLWNTATLRKVLVDPTYVGRHPLGVVAPAIIEQSVYDRAQRLRKANKRLHPPRKDPWPMQGRLKCVSCGSTLQCEYSGGHRYYRCPGRTTRSKYYLQTGRRCDLKGLRADDVEEQLLAGLCNAMLKPDNFARALERTIAELHSRIGDLEREAGPLAQALHDAGEELKRIDRAWIRGRLSDDELVEMERDAEARRERIQSQLDALGAGDLEDLERTRSLIGAAQASLAMAKTAGVNWWSHPEAPPMWFTDVLTPPGWPPGDFLDRGAPETVVYDTFPEVDSSHTARTLKEALDRLQAEIWAKPESLEVRGLINVKVADGDGVPVLQLRKPPDSEEGAQALGTPSTSSPRTERDWSLGLS